MPRYEMSLILRLLDRPEKIVAMKDICTNLMKRGFNIRKLDSLGDRGLPVKMTKDKETHMEGTYFLFDVDLSLANMSEQKKYLREDPNVLRHTFFRHGLVHEQERFCGGMKPVNYDEKLEKLSKVTLKRKPIPTISKLKLHDIVLK